MNNTAPLIEYGVPIDPQTMVTPQEATELELEPGHPGEGDAGYIQRAKELLASCVAKSSSGTTWPPAHPLLHRRRRGSGVRVSPKLDEAARQARQPDVP